MQQVSKHLPDLFMLLDPWSFFSRAEQIFFLLTSEQVQELGRGQDIQPPPGASNS